jgi:hypothetical protein
MQPRLPDLVVLVEQQGHLAVTLDAGQRLDADPSQGLGVTGGF